MTCLVIRDNQRVPGPACTSLRAAAVDCWITEIGSSLLGERSDPLSECECEGRDGCAQPAPPQSEGVPGPQRKSPGGVCSPALLGCHRPDTQPSSSPSGRRLPCGSEHSRHQQTPCFRSPGTER